ncbi:MAG: DNA starvation/stationary phase protection protein [Alphaproteobacteria bacterium]|nr:DNA starvation/stationary phase protection protein [Alphaproteobacteria bacterium]
MAANPLNVVAEELPVETGVAKADREKLAGLLNQALAASYVLYAKTHAFHWNVAGPQFYGIHKLTDEQYQDLAAAIDEIAERVRAIGFPAMSGLANYIEASVVDDVDVSEMPGARDMVAQLARDHQAIAAKMREAVSAAEAADDVYSADLLTGRIGVHEEAAWMLNSIVAE